MDRMLRAVRALGRKPAVSAVAGPSLFSLQAEMSAAGQKPGEDASASEKTTAEPATATMRLNRYLDAVVHFSSSSFVFLLTTAAVLAWALLSIKFASAASWAIAISNVQAIVCYVYDSLLIRQQLTGYEDDVRNVAILQSRLISLERMMKEAQRQGYLTKPTRAEVEDIMANAAATKTEATDTPHTVMVTMHHWISRLADAIAAFLGHIITVFLFWVCIAIWLAFGPFHAWSNEWQLYMNSSSSALLLLVFVVLANIRDRHAARVAESFAALAKTDEQLEVQLRKITGDSQPNPTVTIPAPNVSRGQRAIFYYADLVGTLTGVVIMLLVTTAWLAVGPALGFSDNWWLLIGTYAGLIGMHDGFVLENMQTCLHGYIDCAMATVHDGDEALLHNLGLLASPVGDVPDAEAGGKRRGKKQLTVIARISQVVVGAMSHPAVVLLNVIVIVGLLIGASVLGWNVTGQLLCNVPPSIIESFMMLIVITGHDLADEKQQEDLELMHSRRLELLCWAEVVASTKA